MKINILNYKISSHNIMKIIVFLLIIISFDIIIGKTLEYFYFQQDSGFLYRTTYALEETNADLLVFGSSKANHHYEPEIFKKRLNTSFYNAGRDGNTIFYHNALLKGILTRYSPKVVILDLTNCEFSVDRTVYDRLSSLLPYYKKHHEMRSTIELRSPYEKFKLLSEIYPYNSSLFSILIGNLDYNKTRVEDKEGFVPLYGGWGEQIANTNNSAKYDLDTNLIAAYESFIRICKNADIKLEIVSSPSFVNLQYEDYSIKVAKEIAKKYKINFFDYSNNQFFINSPSVFMDPGHLNVDGAKIFSNLFIDEMLKADSLLIKSYK